MPSHPISGQLSIRLGSFAVALRIVGTTLYVSVQGYSLGDFTPAQAHADVVAELNDGGAEFTSAGGFAPRGRTKRLISEISAGVADGYYDVR